MGGVNILTRTLTLTGYMTGTVTYMNEVETKRASAMESKEIYCGECDKFLYEDINGYGLCDKIKEECRCCDLCHLIHGKP